jgi:hypothetical protein
MIFFVYIDWTLEDVPRSFYIGNGVFARVQKHERNAYWKNIAAKYGWKPSVDWLLARSGSNAPLFGKKGKQHPYFGRHHTVEWLENHRGEKHPAAKVTEQEVFEIREKYASGMYTQKELEMSYGITQCVVSCLIRGKNWKHVPKT